jgi:outer membrane assembly lipoprotein YfiO
MNLESMKNFIVPLCSLLALCACNRGFDSEGLARPEVEALADSAFRTGEWHEAERLYTEILFNFPGATDTDTYLYRLAVSDSEQRLWADAEFNLRRLIEEYPRSRMTDDAQLELARVFWRRHGDFRRDQEPVESALSELSVFFERHPGSDLTGEALALRDSCMEEMAKRAFFVGRFYARRGLDDAALLYYRSALDEYQGQGCTGDLLIAMGDLYMSTGNSFAARNSYRRAIDECVLDEDQAARAASGLERASAP